MSGRRLLPAYAFLSATKEQPSPSRIAFAFTPSRQPFDPPFMRPTKHNKNTNINHEWKKSFIASFLFMVNEKTEKGKLRAQNVNSDRTDKLTSCHVAP